MKLHDLISKIDVEDNVFISLSFELKYSELSFYSY